MPCAGAPGPFRRTNPALSVLVVGAGPAGLAVMSALRAAGVAFDAVESHTGVGGIWDISNPVSSVYDGLRTVTSRFTSYLASPMPEDWGDYPRHDQVRRYFRDFADAEKLLPRITFGTRFETAAKTEREVVRLEAVLEVALDLLAGEGAGMSGGGSRA